MRTSREPLAAQLDRLSGLCDEVGAKKVRALRCRLQAGDLRLLLVGEAKRGKSTLGNAILGREVLPSGVLPATAVATELRCGSPERVEVRFSDGRVVSANLGELAGFVSERGNPGNQKGVAGARVYLPAGLPHPRMVLVDTPGVGSVLQSNTDEARAALDGMDAAIFVLTTDPPISASELELLSEVAQLSVRTFVVLNKTDLLTVAERAEAVDYVRDTITKALDREVQLWPCSARQGLRARLGGDGESWVGSGVPALLDAILAQLSTRRERDLRMSIARAARRTAARDLDRVTVTLATLDALRTSGEQRVAMFARRLQDWRGQCDDAVAVGSAEIRRQRSRLREQTVCQVAAIRERVRGALDAFLSQSAALPAADWETRGREVIATVARASLEQWRAAFLETADDALAQVTRRQQAALHGAFAELRGATEKLLGVELQASVGSLPAPELSRLAYDFEAGPGWNEALIAGLRRRAPGGTGRRWVAAYLRAEADRLVDKHVGRARADFSFRLEQTELQMAAAVRTAFDEYTRSLQAAATAAAEALEGTVSERERERCRLNRHRNELASLVNSLAAAAEEGDEPDGIGVR